MLSEINAFLRYKTPIFPLGIIIHFWFLPIMISEDVVEFQSKCGI